jgi:hypothetical protein
MAAAPEANVLSGGSLSKQITAVPVTTILSFKAFLFSL